jgi:hypothetical protein
MKTDDPDRLVTVGPAAKHYGIGPRPVRAAIRRGELATYQIGQWTRIRLGDLAAWIESHRQPARGTGEETTPLARTAAPTKRPPSPNLCVKELDDDADNTIAGRVQRT